MPVGYISRQSNPAKRYIPLIRVSFHTEEACYQLKGSEFSSIEDFQTAVRVDPSMTVMSVSTQKMMNTPAGAFTIQLVGDEWMVKPNDLVVIQMGYKVASIDKIEMNTVMVGLIDTISRSRVAGTNIVTTTVTGRDFGKVLIKENLKFYPELGQANPDAAEGEKFFLTDEGWLTLMAFFTNENIMKGTPATILDNIMRYIVPKLMTVEWTVWDESKSEPVPKKVDLPHILRYNFAKVDLFVPLMLAADQFEGAVWNLMERAAPKPFTELFVDVREFTEAWNPGTAPRVVNETIEQASDESKANFPKGNGYYPPYRFSFGEDRSAVMVVLRNTPFDKNLWEKLYTHEIPEEDVTDETLSISDTEHYNLFWAGTTLTPFGSSFNLKKTAPPMWNRSDAERYGLSPLEVEIDGLAIDTSDPTIVPLIEEVSKTYTAKLKAWFEKNHEYMSGSLTVRGKGNYKIGHRVIYNGREFYVEGVSQAFHMFEGWSTTLTLTRGMPAGSAPDHRTYLSGTDHTAVEKPVSDKSDEEIRLERYVVKNGDTLYGIAAKPEIYGNGSQWTRIWEANKEILIERDSRNISTPGKWIYPGQVLRIPR